jgi:Leucine-rich repeat (LRR) protein
MAANIVAQNKATADTTVQNEMSAEEFEAIQKQAAQIVKFMEFSFNTVGSNKTEYREKDIVINQSFLKYFRDAKVQVEDDLLEQRDVVTNKDVQAYLKDIDFFYREAEFKFTIEEITRELNDKGEPFFKIKTSRNLKGVTVDGKEINENKPRYIEINLDPATRDLKIVSIYTTRSSEEEELMAWWNSLEPVWRNFFSGETLLQDGYKMGFIQEVAPAYMLINTGERVGDSLYIGDTIKSSPGSLLVEVRKIWRKEQLDISNVQGIYDLEPLSALTMLKQLNMSGSRVANLGPIRNLSKLETLIASSTQITDLSPIQYTTGIRYLDLSSAPVSDISALGNFAMMEFLNLSDTRVQSLNVLKNMPALRELRIAGLPLLSLDGISDHASLELLDMNGLKISDFNALSGLSGLKRIVLTNTFVDDLGFVSTMQGLQYVYLDYAPVTDIKPLLTLPDLKAVYCDKTMIDKQAALSFIQSRPDVKVIYESEELSVWWSLLADDWKSVFKKMVQVGDPPLREELYEISTLREMDIAGNDMIKNLAPLQKLPSLSNINASRTSITGVSEIKELAGLRELNIANTAVADLKPLADISSLISLNISNTKAKDIKPLSGLWNLKLLEMDSVPVEDASVILRLKRLEKLYADGVPAVTKIIDQIWDTIPNALVIYQGATLIKWWDGLSPAWKKVFAQIEPHTGIPDREQLHKIASITELDISRNMGIADLMPVAQLKKLDILRFSGTPVVDLLPVGLIRRLKELDCSNTPASDLKPITTHRGLVNLNCSNTQVKDIKPLEQLGHLQILDISGTEVKNLKPLSSLTKLEQLYAFNTRISSIKALDDLRAMQVLRIYNSRVSERNISKFKESHPKVEVVYY